jgi:hypothetical protein
MNKRMKDPKGDLRFVHKLTRIYDFSSLKLTAMTYRRQAGRRDFIRGDTNCLYSTNFHFFILHSAFDIGKSIK